MGRQAAFIETLRFNEMQKAHQAHAAPYGTVIQRG